jgi:hypothetical protein
MEVKLLTRRGRKREKDWESGGHHRTDKGVREWVKEEEEKWAKEGRHWRDREGNNYLLTYDSYVPSIIDFIGGNGLRG